MKYEWASNASASESALLSNIQHFTTLGHNPLKKTIAIQKGNKMSGVELQWIVCSLACLVLCSSVRCTTLLDAVPSIDHGPNRSGIPREKFRILGAFGHPGKSHFDMFGPLLEELARRGHDITVISYFPRKNTSAPLPNYRDINLARDDSDVYVDVLDLHNIQHSSTRIAQELLLLRSWALETCEYALSNPQVLDLVKSDRKFDLIITEGFNSDCFLGFVHRFKAPFICLSSHDIMPWIHQRLANDDNPSYIPTQFQSLEPKMTFFQRLRNALVLPFIKIGYHLGTNIPSQTMVEKVFGPGVPPLMDIARNTSAVLVNTHFSLMGAKPQLPNIIEVGGIHISPNPQPLPADIQRFLDEAHEGVLYFSLGSMIKSSTMPEEKLARVIKVIGSIPRKVIWKWETENMPNKPANVMIKKWLPQSAILRHPNVKCYVAHGGLLGLSEGVQAGVPMVIIPMYGDQFHNAAAASSRGVAEVLEWGVLSEDTLRTALDRIFNDTRYGVNAKALSKAYLDRPETPLETAVWWTEYIARGNGNPYLKSAALDLTWYQYYLIDIVLFIGAVALIAVYVNYRIVIFLIAAFNSRHTDSSVSDTNRFIRSHTKTVKRE